MRLLNSATLRFEQFEGDSIPPYAILSHTWGDDEVLLQDMEKGVQKKKAAYPKIARAAQLASKEGLSYLWVDTCCIDKSSSAELSEAINSMYQWYKKARVCYAYLSDVSRPPSTIFVGATPLPEFEESRWFTRGWTLQELLAPTHLIFYDKDWQRIGSKSDLEEYVIRATGINSAALSGKDLRSFSVAQRMCWASKRNTTRIEDLAYCLLGIFDVNMPLLYGEGQKSFIRLQHEIMKSTEDQSLFAWKDPDPDLQYSTGLLARNPGCFAESGRFSSPQTWGRLNPSEVTSRGIYTKLYLMSTGTMNMYRACLGCTVNSLSNDSPAIYLSRTSDLMTSFEKENEYTRVSAARLDIVGGIEKVRGQHKEVYVREREEARFLRVQEYRDVNVFWINLGSCRVRPQNQWDPQSEFFWSPKNTADGKMGAIYVVCLQNPLLIIFGICPTRQKPWCHTTNTVRTENIFGPWETYKPDGTERASSSIDLNTPEWGSRSAAGRLYVRAYIRECVVYGTTVYRVNATARRDDSEIEFQLL